MQPVRTSIAVLCRHPAQPGKILLVQRPADDPELPGIWGLPAVSLRPGESDREALERLAATKLGTQLHGLRFCGEADQQRPGYHLRMRLYEAILLTPELHLPAPSSSPGVTLYSAWHWGSLEELRPGAAAGSLCCSLALRFADADAE